MNHVDNPEITHVSHCFGYGGIDIALHRVFGRGFVTIAACEIEAYAVANALEKVEEGRFGHDFPVWTDVKTFPYGAFHGLVDVYSAGFPCQPFSAAGQRAADDDPRHLWPFIRDGIGRMRPEFVFLENVEGIISAKLKGSGWSDPEGTPVLLHVLRELERLGYEPEAGVFSAVEVGASHQRKRVFILARLANGDGERQSQLRGCISDFRQRAGNGGEMLADSAGSLRLGSRQLRERFAPFDGQDMADSCCERRSEITGGASEYEDPNGCPRWDGIKSNSHYVPHGGRKGMDHTASSRRDHERKRAEAMRQGEECLLGDGCDPVGNPDNSRLEGRALCGCGCADQCLTGKRSLPVFPPGPGLGGSGAIDGVLKLFARDAEEAWRLYQAELLNTERWIDILAIRPDLAPALSEAESALYGVADGIGNRVDRLRLCGNGVVWLTATKAFLTLMERLKP